MEIHRSLAFALFLDQVGLGVWGLVLGFRRRPLGSGFFSAIVVDEALLVANVVVGLVLFLSGAKLKSNIHFLYGFLLFALPPVVWYYAARRERAGIWLGATLLFLAGVIIRAYFTG